MGSTIRQFKAEIRANTMIAKELYQLTFGWDGVVPAPLPGQFFTVRVSSLTQPLLRRPFAFSGYDPDAGTASCIYLKRGVATDLLSAKRCGDTLDIIGPLGNWFQFEGCTPESSVLLVAGGIGLGPMLFCAEWLKKQKRQSRFIVGFRTASVVPHEVCAAINGATLCTDDGSAGFSGTVVDYLNRLAEAETAEATIFGCGPTPMLRGLADYALSRSLACFVSMEQIMACGVGACMGCTIKVRDSRQYVRVCKEGSVFDAREVQWS